MTNLVPELSTALDPDLAISRNPQEFSNFGIELLPDRGAGPELLTTDLHLPTPPRSDQEEKSLLVWQIIHGDSETRIQTIASATRQLLHLGKALRIWGLARLLVLQQVPDPRDEASLRLFVPGKDSNWVAIAQRCSCDQSWVAKAVDHESNFPKAVILDSPWVHLSKFAHSNLQYHPVKTLPAQESSIWALFDFLQPVAN